MSRWYFLLAMWYSNTASSIDFSKYSTYYQATTVTMLLWILHALQCKLYSLFLLSYLSFSLSFFNSFPFHFSPIYLFPPSFSLLSELSICLLQLVWSPSWNHLPERLWCLASWLHLFTGCSSRHNSRGRGWRTDERTHKHTLKEVTLVWPVQRGHICLADSS